MPTAKHTPFDPSSVADEVVARMVARNPGTTAVQWTVTVTWSTAHRPTWRAEAYHPGRFVQPLAATSHRGPRSALRRLLDAARR
jgi:hypothetical protein